MPAIVVGTSHRAAPLEALERIAIPAEALAKALVRLRERPSVEEAVILSTCGRTEVYALVREFHAAAAEIRDFLVEGDRATRELVEDRLYTYADRGAAEHLFTVAAGLDSALIGESDVLRQVRTAWQRALDEKAAGRVLSRLFRHAVEVGKRARAETGIGRGVTSVSQAAVELAAAHLGGTFAGRRALVVGAGEMGSSLVNCLSDRAELTELLVTNRTEARAVDLARRVGGQAVPPDVLSRVLEQVDVLFSTTNAPGTLFDADDLCPIVAARGGRPLLIVDFAVPRDVDASVAGLPGVTLLDMDALRRYAQEGLHARRREAARVRTIVVDEVDRYAEATTARQAAPVIAALRQHAGEIRRKELERFAPQLAQLEARQRDAVEALTSGIVAKLLHTPTVRLKETTGVVAGSSLADAIEVLFDLSPIQTST
jgi:glutamyl-tRNA reductase